MRKIESITDFIKYCPQEYRDARRQGFINVVCEKMGWEIPFSHCNKKEKEFLFIKKSKIIHVNKYDYSLVQYNGTKTKVKIICSEHGTFEQKPENHLSGRGCPKCVGKYMNSNDYILKAKKIHGDRYDYSLVQYKNNSIKIKIICSEHGIFEQAPYSHLSGRGCPKCAGRIVTDVDFILRSNKIHGKKYDYSLVQYMTTHKKVKIICPEHGIFEQAPSGHLSGRGCPKCVGKYMNSNDYILKAKKIHGDRYDYSLTEYNGTNEKVKIICPKHGVFEQLPNNHLQPNRCPKCVGHTKLTNDDYILKAKKIHGDRYDYSLTEYKNNNTKIKIICPKHGVFEQIPSKHVNMKRGCKECKKKKVASIKLS